MPIAHTLIKVAAAEHAAVVNFYSNALKPLGYEKLRTLGNGMTFFGTTAPEWVVAIGDENSSSKVHVAFAASDRGTVDAFHSAALAAGGKDNGAAGPRPHVHPDCYAAFALDPAGNNIEAICMAPADAKKL